MFSALQGGQSSIQDNRIVGGAEMPRKALEVTDEDFASIVATGVTLVEFWTPWCGFCQLQRPIVEQVAARLYGSASVARVNAATAPRAAFKYGIHSIPTLIIFKDGELVEQFVGVHSEADIIAAIEQAVSQGEPHCGSTWARMM
jgi:thioredoxin 1